MDFDSNEKLPFIIKKAQKKTKIINKQLELNAQEKMVNINHSLLIEEI